MKLLRIVLCILSVVALSFGANAKTIKMAKANWDTGYFQAEIYKMALEELGYKVAKPQAIKPSVFYVAAAQGDIDLWVDSSEYNIVEMTHHIWLLAIVELLIEKKHT